VREKSERFVHDDGTVPSLLLCDSCSRVVVYVYTCIIILLWWQNYRTRVREKLAPIGQTCLLECGSSKQDFQIALLPQQECWRFAAATLFRLERDRDVVFQRTTSSAASATQCHDFFFFFSWPTNCWSVTRTWYDTTCHAFD
jgi:hypothetical protein